MKKLTFVTVLRGYKGKGSLVIFKEIKETGDFKGKPIVFWSSDLKYEPSTKQGWEYDEENDRVIEPVLSREERDESKLRFAHSLGIELSL